MNRSTTQNSAVNELCPWCQRVSASTRPLVGELIVDVLGLCLLLALLLVIVPPVVHWVDQQEQRWIGNMTWREPLNI